MKAILPYYAGAVFNMDKKHAKEYHDFSDDQTLALLVILTPDLARIM